MRTFLLKGTLAHNSPVPSMPPLSLSDGISFVYKPAGLCLSLAQARPQPVQLVLRSARASELNWETDRRGVNLDTTALPWCCRPGVCASAPSDWSGPLVLNIPRIPPEIAKATTERPPREVCVLFWHSSYQRINAFKITSGNNTFTIWNKAHSLLSVHLEMCREGSVCVCVCVCVFVCVCASVGKTNTLTSSTVSGIHMRYSFINMVLLQRGLSLRTVCVYLSCLGCIVDRLRQVTLLLDCSDLFSDALLPLFCWCQ